MNYTPVTTEQLAAENQNLLKELERAYTNMAVMLDQANREKEIAYAELQEKFDSLETLYDELSNKENTLIHLEKLSSVGQFITEIIHELMSPLSAISGHVELMRLLDPAPDFREHVDQIGHELDRMSDYLNRFKGMVYKGQEDFRLFDLNTNLRDCLGTIEIIKPKSVQIEVCLCEDDLPVHGDPYQTNQIYLNLAKNAFDAMKSNGDALTFTTRCVDADWLKSEENYGAVYCQSERSWIKTLEQQERFAIVEIRDNGKGIPPELLKDIFQPFFTTKGRGKGTGLGLSISTDIAKRHKGNIAVQSTIGVGTAFQLAIPLANDV